MLKQLDLKNFTVFADDALLFSPGLNIVLGENGTGKSHLLKIGYVAAQVAHSLGRAQRQTKDEMAKQLADKLVAVFRPESLGRLVSRKQGRNRSDVTVTLGAPGGDCRFSFSFATNSKTDVRLDAVPSVFPKAGPVFIPTREMLSVFPGFAAAYRQRELEFDETYFDLALALEDRPLRGPRPASASHLIGNLEDVMEGQVVVDNGRFYLRPNAPGAGKLEMPLVAEGVRKIAMVAYLLVNGWLRDKSILFWDEPETNLNPKLVRNVAETLMALAKQGVQVIAATHSLFLLREIEILMGDGRFKRVATRFIALAPGAEEVHVSVGDRPEDVDPIAALDADLEQSDRYMEAE
jgi:ABC-type transport system involved in cytochrome c biogenesis ATPase subunit